MSELSNKLPVLWRVIINDSSEYNTVRYIVYSSTRTGAMGHATARFEHQNPDTQIDIVTIERIHGRIIDV